MPRSTRTWMRSCLMASCAGELMPKAIQTSLPQAALSTATNLQSARAPLRSENLPTRMYSGRGNQGMLSLLSGGILQRKLTINEPGDIYEQEADRVADQVMRMPTPAKTEDSTATASMHSKPGLQRCSCGASSPSGGECEECKSNAMGLQRSAAAPSPKTEAPPIVSEALRSPGQPLDQTTRDFLEPRFGTDFSEVRVHTGAQAAESARAVNALAYTVGKDVVFGAAQYSPENDSGRRLLEHELR